MMRPRLTCEDDTTSFLLRVVRRLTIIRPSTSFLAQGSSSSGDDTTSFLVGGTSSSGDHATSCLIRGSSLSDDATTSLNA